jgi:hypothetical protein
MRKIITLILLILSLSVSAQFHRDTVVHIIDVKHMQYQPCYRTGINTFTPVNWIKVTTKIGINTSAAKQDFISIVEKNGQEIEPFELYNLFGYDTRIKFYLTKRLRILIKTQYFGSMPGFPNQHYYSAGLFYKF